MDKTANDMVTKARTSLILDKPFFGTLALRLKVIEDENITTMCVNGKVMKYNPTWVKSLTQSDVKLVVAHEVMHCVLGHPARTFGRNPRKMNICTDYVVNELLEKSGFSAPTNTTWLRETAYDNMSADHIYNLLPDVDGSPYGPGQSKGPMDEVEAGDSNPVEAEAQTRDWQIAAVQAANAARMRGNLPGHLERFCGELFASKLDWKTVLRRFITAGTDQGDYTWNRPARRYIPHGLVLPSMHSEAMGKMAVIVDVSGSIDNDTLTAFGSEVSAIASDAQPEEVHVMYVDTRVAHADVFKRGEQVVLAPHGGGGTDMREGFEYIKEHQIDPVCTIVLTDGYTPFPDTVDGPNLWIMTTDVVSPIGETLRIEV